jgi:four helix bundle protein
MAKEYGHRNLIVWQRAQELAHQIIKLTHRLPQNWANAVLARQIISSATSVGANIAEGHGRFKPGAHGNHLSIAKGSAAETDSWLDTLCREGYLSREDEAPLHKECLEIMAMLTSKIQQLERLEKDSSTKIREEKSLYDISNVLDEPLFPFTATDYQ